MRGRKVAPPPVSDLAEFYKTESQPQIAARYGVSAGTVKKWLREAGIEKQPGWPRLCKRTSYENRTKRAKYASRIAKFRSVVQVYIEPEIVERIRTIAALRNCALSVVARECLKIGLLEMEG